MSPLKLHLLKLHLLALIVLSLSSCSTGVRTISYSPTLPQKWQELPAEQSASSLSLRAQSPLPSPAIPSSLGPPTAFPAQSPFTKTLRPLSDPALDHLLQIARVANLDVRQAQARLAEVRAYCRAQRASLYPQLSFLAQPQYGKFSGTILSESPGLSANLFDLHGSVSWEIDLLGKQQLVTKAAELQVAAYRDLVEATWISLSGEIARLFVDWQGCQKERKIVEQELAIQRELVELARWRWEQGVQDGQETESAQNGLCQLQAQLPLIDSRDKQALYQLDLLTGALPGSSAQWLTAQPLPVLASKSALSFPLPSELLQRRPDIRAADRALRSALGLERVAQLNFFPSFTLTGALGQQSLFARDLTASKSRYWTFVPGLYLPLFQGGLLKAELQVQEAQSEQALINYDQTVLQALVEVEQALQATREQGLATQSLEEGIRFQREQLDQLHTQYEIGVADSQAYLQMEQSLLESERALVQSQVATYESLLLLYRALAGDWEGSEVIIAPLAPLLSAESSSCQQPTAPEDALAQE